MIFTDGECPICRTVELRINNFDLYECPKCNLMFSLANPVLATLMPERGLGKFRFENTRLQSICGAGIAKSENGGVLPDIRSIFFNMHDLQEYADSIKTPLSKASDNQETWLSFKEAFCLFMQNHPKENIFEHWAGNTSRTNFYKTTLMPFISSELNLISGNEEFKVDYVMPK